MGLLVEACLAHEGSREALQSSMSRLEAQEQLLDAAVFKVRETLYYSGERGGMADMCYKAFGPPMERFCILFCLKECSRLARMPTIQPSEGGARGVARATVGVWDEITGWRQGIYAGWMQVQGAGEWVWQVRRDRWNVEELAASRGAYAAKLTVANLIAMYIGILMTGSGLWAAVAVCFIGPRDSTRAGAGLRTGMLRVVGTVFGSMWGYTAAFITRAQGQLGFWHLTVLAAWVFFSGFPRANPSTAYGAQVICLLPPPIRTLLVQPSSARYWCNGHLTLKAALFLAGVAVYALHYA